MTDGRAQKDGRESENGRESGRQNGGYSRRWDADSHSQTATCENCGQERYTFERCNHCGNIHWEQ